MIGKRVFWGSTGYVAGAASSWWVQRKVRRTAERVLPDAIRSEAGARFNDVSQRARDAANAAPVVRLAKERRARHLDADPLTEGSSASVIDLRPSDTAEAQNDRRGLADRAASLRARARR